jgi:hypothetical protein
MTAHGSIAPREGTSSGRLGDHLTTVTVPVELTDEYVHQDKAGNVIDPGLICVPFEIINRHPRRLEPWASDHQH